MSTNSPSPSTPPRGFMTEGDALSTFHRRVVTALLMLAAAGVILLAGGWLFVLAIMAIAVLMDKEWQTLQPADDIRWRIFGIVYITLPCIAALSLRELSLFAVLFPLLLVIATDTGAYFFGKRFGNRKLAPVISPNKTWAGLWGAMFCAGMTAVLLQGLVPWPNGFWASFLLGAAMAVVSQMGDLFESWLKRRKGLKDSGNILPGHGGILDRLDGQIPVLPLYLLFLILCAEAGL